MRWRSGGRRGAEEGSRRRFPQENARRVTNHGGRKLAGPGAPSPGTWPTRTYPSSRPATRTQGRGTAHPTPPTPSTASSAMSPASATSAAKKQKGRRTPTTAGRKRKEQPRRRREAQTSDGKRHTARQELTKPATLSGFQASLPINFPKGIVSAAFAPTAAFAGWPGSKKVEGTQPACLPTSLLAAACCCRLG